MLQIVALHMWLHVSTLKVTLWMNGRRCTIYVTKIINHYSIATSQKQLRIKSIHHVLCCCACSNIRWMIHLSNLQWANLFSIWMVQIELQWFKLNFNYYAAANQNLDRISEQNLLRLLLDSVFTTTHSISFGIPWIRGVHFKDPDVFCKAGSEKSCVRPFFRLI